APVPLLPRRFFVSHPQRPRFALPADEVAPTPDGVPVDRGVLTANLETALNILWDGNAAAGDRIVVIGGGIVGMLVAALASRLPGAEVIAVDVDPARAAIARHLRVS